MGRCNLLSVDWIKLITNDQFLVNEDYYLGRIRGQIKDGEVNMTHVKDRYIRWIMERMNFGVHAIGKAAYPEGVLENRNMLTLLPSIRGR